MNYVLGRNVIKILNVDVIWINTVVYKMIIINVLMNHNVIFVPLLINIAIKEVMMTVYIIHVKINNKNQLLNLIIVVHVEMMNYVLMVNVLIKGKNVLIIRIMYWYFVDKMRFVLKMNVKKIVNHLVYKMKLVIIILMSVLLKMNIH